ncbi:hypothetical protein, partial [Mycolicibacterium mageritense]|uniref:hypothetical protein n=1 Tax=Mycolicibacterium mageritense TaxID=53462 RepID=UPI0023F1308B
PRTAQNAPEPIDVYLDGAGDDTRLAADYCRTDPFPADVEDFATHQVLNPKRLTWETNHQARMSVVVNAIARGHSLADLRDHISPGGAWHNGLGAAYLRYKYRADLALSKDFTKALNWYVTNVVKSSPPRHREKNYSPGGSVRGWRGPEKLRAWLANAMAWADAEYGGKRLRWTVHAVLQGLAFYAAVAGEQRSGTWLVGVGGRTLSIGCGLLSEDTVWRVLSDLRDRPGAPLILTRRGIGTEADTYALTTQNRVSTDVARIERVRVEAVHQAWSVLGHHLRRIYELVAYHGLTCKADIYAAAAVPRATGDAMVTDLQVVGLLAKSGWGTVTVGPVALDDIAARHHLDEIREQRIERHRAERAAWREWLDAREQQRLHGGTGQDAPLFPPASIGSDDAEEHAAWQRAALADGPPQSTDVDIEFAAIELISDVLGGRILSPRLIPPRGPAPPGCHDTLV